MVPKDIRVWLNLAMGNDIRDKLLSPECAVQGSVLNRFRNVFGLNGRGAFEIGNRTRDFENSIVGACAESLLRDRALEEALAVGGQFAIRPDLPWRHLCIAVNLVAAETLDLRLASPNHALPNRVGIFRYVC